MRTISHLSRFLIGAVFVFSGFVKAIDPLGFSYKLSDYFQAFGFDFMIPMALVIAIILSTLELSIGLNLILGIKLRQTSWVLLIFMLYFIILTYIIAIKNPVTDCGCFGDAIILSNWQTFYKNLIFLPLAIIVFMFRNKFNMPAFISNRISLVVSLSVGIALSIYCLLHLPLIDFRPYKIGTDIKASMEIPEGAPIDEYETTLVYEKEGQEIVLKPDELYRIDSTWKWKDTRNVLVKKGYVPPIHDFSITSTNGFDYTSDVLNDQQDVYLLISHSLSKANSKGLREVTEYSNKKISQGKRVIMLTSAVSEEINSFKENYKPQFEIFLTDEITLKTIIRSNPGLTLINSGVVKNHWNFRDLPL